MNNAIKHGSLRNEMKTCLTTSLLIIAATAIASMASLNASDMIMSTSQGVGAFNTTLGNVNVETFDGLSTGVNNNVSWNGVGTFDSLNVKSADQYGGAPTAANPKGSQYAVEGLNVVNTTTLRLNTASSYFGLYWSAGDAANDLKFYNGNTLVADFTTANLMNKLPGSYYGNPITAGSNAGKNSGEPYGFINFVGDANTSWDRIVFGNNAGSGFEADNYTSRVNGWNPITDGALPGTPLLELKNGTLTSINAVPVDFAAAPGAPAPSLTACLAFAGVLLLQALRRAKTVA